MHRNPNDYLEGQKRAYLTNLKPTLELVKSFEYFLYEQVFSSNGVIPFLDDVPMFTLPEDTQKALHFLCFQGV